MLQWGLQLICGCPYQEVGCVWRGLDRYGTEVGRKKWDGIVDEAEGKKSGHGWSFMCLDLLLQRQAYAHNKHPNLRAKVFILFSQSFSFHHRGWLQSVLVQQQLQEHVVSLFSTDAPTTYVQRLIMMAASQDHAVTVHGVPKIKEMLCCSRSWNRVTVRYVPEVTIAPNLDRTGSFQKLFVSTTNVCRFPLIGALQVGHTSVTSILCSHWYSLYMLAS